MSNIATRHLSEETQQYLLDMPDELLSTIKFSTPWQYDVKDAGSQSYVDSDGFPLTSVYDKEETQKNLQTLQEESWRKFHQNPHINSTVRGNVGRLTGFGFEVTSDVFDIQEVIDEIELDWRNRLYTFWPKYMGRFNIEGELFLCLSPNDNGFIEVDFVDPGTISEKGDSDSGILFHPNKPTLPLFYNISSKNDNKYTITDQIPSIYVAFAPDLKLIANKHADWDTKLQKNVRSRKKIHRQFGGYKRFIISMDKGFVTRRAVSHLRTTLIWLNYYEDLKKYEIDHKKSAGSYLWVFSIEDPKAYKIWLAMSDEDKRKTGIVSKKTPGSSLVLPPGMKVEVINPNLPTIREEDTDIKEMVGAGLNEPDDIMTGASKGTFASVKATRGPMSDRTSDEIAYFERFLKYDFWRSIFFLRNAILGDKIFPKYFSVKEAVGWKGKKPQFKNVKRPPERLIDISFPVSEVIDFEARARGLLGVKHGPVAESMGVPNSEVARRIGIGGYPRMRLRKATEDDKYPELKYELGADAEASQEVKLEPGKKQVKPKENNSQKK